MPKNMTFSVSKFSVGAMDDKRFLELEMWVCNEGLNRNQTIITNACLMDSMYSFTTVPIVATYSKDFNEFGGHDRVLLGVDADGFGVYDYIEQPIGVVPSDQNVRIEQDEEGKNWIVVDALIWSERNRKIEKLLKKRGKNKISMEIFADQSHEDENGIEVIDKFTALAITLLGESKKTGIEGAMAHVKKFDFDDVPVFRHAMQFAMNESFAKEDMGTGKEIPLKLDRKSVSNDSWGDVDKTALRQEILKASNYKTLVNACYMQVDKGWEDAPSQKLGYPVCQIKGGSLVYNKGGIMAARKYLEANKSEPYYNRVSARLRRVERRVGGNEEHQHIKYGKEEGEEVDFKKFGEVFSANGKQGTVLGANKKFVFFISNEDRKVEAFPYTAEGENYAINFKDLHSAKVYCDFDGMETEPDEDDADSPEVTECVTEMACDQYATKAQLDAAMEAKNQAECDKAMAEEKAKEAESHVEMADKEKECAAQNLQESEQKAKEFEAKVAELSAQLKQFEARELTEKLTTVLKQYSAKMTPAKESEWKEKAQQYSSPEAFEKDLVFELFKSGDPQHTKMPVGKDSSVSVPTTPWKKWAKDNK